MIATVSPDAEGTSVVGEDVDSSDSSATQLTTDQVFHILQNERRRGALRYLMTQEGPVEMRALAEQVAAWENDTTVDELESDERKRVYIALYQSHLPKLDDEGIITYHQDRGIIEATPLTDHFEPYLKPDAEDPSGIRSHLLVRWSTGYLVLSVVGLIAVVARVRNFFGPLQSSTLEFAILGAIFVLAAAHAFSDIAR